MAAKDLYEKDYYQILGVTKNSDAAAIKKQYRKLARELHPDKTKGSKRGFYLRQDSTRLWSWRG